MFPKLEFTFYGVFVPVKQLSPSWAAKWGTRSSIAWIMASYSVTPCHTENKGLLTGIRNWLVCGQSPGDISTTHKTQVLRVAGWKVTPGIVPWIWVPISLNSSTFKFCGSGMFQWRDHPSLGRSLFHLSSTSTFLRLWALAAHGSTQETHF